MSRRRRRRAHHVHGPPAPARPAGLAPELAARLEGVVARHKAGDVVGALAEYRAILLANPRNAIAFYYAALGCQQLDRLDLATAFMRQSLRLFPDNPDAWFNLGKFLRDAGDEESAHMAYMECLARDPQHTEALISCGDHYWRHGHHDDARACWRAALASVPKGAEGRHYRAFLRLRFGDPAGWEDYESRWASPTFARTYARPEFARIPLWTGAQPLAGQRIILHGEQGLGDQIQMLRYVPLVRDMGATVVLEVLPSLVRLARSSFPGVTVFARGEHYAEPVDLHCPTMSLPHRFLGLVPERVPYLTTDAPCPVRLGSGLRVGIVWAGSKEHVNDRNRSCPVLQTAPLWDVRGVSWVSLQIGPRAHEADGTPFRRVDHAVTDFADSAAIVERLDLVIAVDTSTAHLAGALGVPVWLIQPTLPEWRWGLDAPTTPWYPSVTMHYQRRKGDWVELMGRLRADLAALAAGVTRAAA